jgi:hypothetical protein
MKGPCKGAGPAAGPTRVGPAAGLVRQEAT